VLSAFATCGLSKLTLTRERAGQYFLGMGCNPCNIDGFEIETMLEVLYVSSGGNSDWGHIPETYNVLNVCM
jgi:hypothetical protein